MESKRVRKIVFRLLFAVEIGAFCYAYFFGAHGMRMVYGLNRERNQLASHVEQMRLNIASLRRDIDAWEHDPFYKERCAREQLHMARADEKVYYLG